MFGNIDRDLQQKDLFKFAKAKTGLRPSVLCLSVVLAICFLAVFDIGADWLTDLFGMVYPAYMSYQV
jgi:hypothetical protein